MLPLQCIVKCACCFKVGANCSCDIILQDFIKKGFIKRALNQMLRAGDLMFIKAFAESFLKEC